MNRKSSLPLGLVFFLVFSGFTLRTGWNRSILPVESQSPAETILKTNQPAKFSETSYQISSTDQNAEFSPPPNLQFDRLSAADGMSFSLSTSILQDQQGFMWFGTRYGLNKYDGYNFSTYIPESRQDVLSSNFITTLYQDQTGDIWIGTYADLVRMDHKSGLFIHYKHDPADPQSISPGRINAISEDSSGAIWIGTFGGLHRYDPEAEKFTHFLPDQLILCIYTDRQGGIWLGTASGLWYYSSGSLTQPNPVHYQHNPADSTSLNDDIVMDIQQDVQGKVWVGTQSGGLNRLDPATGEFTHYLSNPDDPYSLSSNRITALQVDELGRLWIGTDNGLNLLDPATGRFNQYHYDPNDLHSLSSESVQDIYMDRSGVVWLATLTGISKFNETASWFTHYGEGPNHPSQLVDVQPGIQPDLSDNVIISVYRDHDGILWVGTSAGGLNRIDRQAGTATVYRHDPADPNSLSIGEVIAIYEDQDGTLWIGTSSGLDRFDPQTGTFTTEQAFQGQTVSSIVEDQQGGLWVSSIEDLLRREPGSSDFTSVSILGDKLALDRIQDIYSDSSGAIWISSQNSGLFRLDLDKASKDPSAAVTHFPQDLYNPESPGISPIMSFYEDTISPDHQTHALWMGSVDDGLIHYDQNTQTFSYFVPELGIAKYISCIQGDEQGYLWMGTALGLARFDPRNETFTYFDARDGLDIGEGLSCNQGEQGEMLFGSVNGLNTFFPEQIRDNPNPPPVVITALNLNNQPLRTNLPPGDQIKLSYQENYLSFDFAALDYAAPAKNQYAYKMEGLDADWIEAGTRRHADYPALKPGSYTFRVKASNNSGVWNVQGTAVGITITPPFWQTWWFLGLISLALVGIVVGGIRLRFKGVESRNLALEEQVRERTHEIEQRHQELEALYQADAELYQHFRLDEILQALVDIAVDILHADKGSLLVWDEAKENLIVRAYNGFNPSTLASMKLKSGMGIAGKVALSGEPISVEDTALHPEVSHQITDPEGIRSFMQVPIKVRGETFGVFSADYLQPRKFNENELRLLIAFAQRAALAIQNAQTYQKDQELAVLEERSRLARELHDAVTQTLFSASLVAEALPATWEKDPQEGRGLLQELRSLSRGALAEMRTLLLELRPAALLETSLADLLRQLGEAASGRTGIPVSVRVEGQAKLPPDVQIVFYRIAQEALNNVIKHSRANQASVQLRYSNENKIATSSESQGEPSQLELSVFLSILDDGRGFDLAAIPSNRLGLGIMQERAKAIGADLCIESQPGQGTQVTILWTQARKQEA